MSQKILIIEDDKAIVKFLTMSLQVNNYDSIVAYTGLDGISVFLRENPSLILLDLGLGDIEGTEIIRQIRMTSEVPIIVISARSTDDDKVEALDLGANDYLTKPFSIAELMARIRVSLRQPKANIPGVTTIFEGDVFEVDFELHRITANGKEIHLTPIEFKILELFIQHQGKVLTHKFLQKEIWGYVDESTEISLRVFVRNIRKKLSTEMIMTEVGIGYRLKTKT